VATPFFHNRKTPTINLCYEDGSPRRRALGRVRQRAQEYKRSFSIQKPRCKLEGEFCFLIWWELIIIGNPIIKKKSKGIGEIFSTIFNLLIFILDILSLKLPFFMLNRRGKKSDRGIIPLPSFFLFSFGNSLRMNN